MVVWLWPSHMVTAISQVVESVPDRVECSPGEASFEGWNGSCLRALSSFERPHDFDELLVALG